jgi:signal transduction histidine kinase
VTVPSDKTWPRLLSLAVHELRTPATVVAGYLRMLMKDRVGPLSDDQRRLVEEAEKSCGRISALLAEMSDLAHLELGDAPFAQQTVDLAVVLRDVVDNAVTGPDFATVTQTEIAGPAEVSGDPGRLQAALAAILRCVQRELPTSSIAVRLLSQSGSAVIAIGSPENVPALARADSAEPAFDELRGGMGMALPLARRVIERHGGRLAVLPDNARAGAAVVLPLRRA